MGCCPAVWAHAIPCAPKPDCRSTGMRWAARIIIGVGDAGFRTYVKTYKPWFIGRDAFLAQEEARKSEVVRFRFTEKGVRMAHLGDPVIDKRGKTIGYVTSCAVDKDGFLTGQAYIDLKYPRRTLRSSSSRAPRKKPAKPLQSYPLVTAPTCPMPPWSYRGSPRKIGLSYFGGAFFIKSTKKG